MLRRLAVAATLLLALAPATASAESALNGGVVAFEIRLPEGASYSKAETTEETDRYFNRAHCECAKAASVPFAMHLSFSTAPDPAVSETVDILTGTLCDDPQMRPTNCGPRDSENNVDPETTSTEAIGTGVDIVLDVDQLLDPKGTEGGVNCPEEEGDALFWAIVDTDDDGIPADDSPAPYAVAYDTKPPPLPINFTVATGAEQAIQLTWTAATENTADVEYWQVLCAHQDDNGTWRPAFDEAPHEARYQRQDDAEICGLRDSILVKELPLAPDDAAAGDVDDTFPAPLAEFDPSYICGEISGDAPSIRVQGLENDEEYTFVLVGVDTVGNYSGATIAGAVTPVPAVDFWEDLDSDGSDVEGGVCLIADTYGDGSGPGGALTDALRRFRDETLAASAAGRWLTAAYYEHLAPLGELARGSVAARIALAIVLVPVVALALAWHLLTLPGLLAGLALAVWLRRTCRRGGAAPWLRPALGATAALLAFTPGLASAQADLDPYWEDDEGFDQHAATDIKWHAGLKLGPYVPAIDAQSGQDTYEEMFGGYAILPVFELDRVLVHLRVGQLGLGGSVGYFGKTANAFLQNDPTPDDGVRDRAEGDETKFRMMPFAAHAVFRVTILDDEFGVPIVPYARGGLSYYLWWVRAPSGKLARVYQDDSGMTCDPDVVTDGSCAANKALGGSLGVQGSIGLAVRAERIDADSAGSMRQSGIYHAGFYAELQMAKVDGFGSDKKLAVGDTTWFAGIDFEF